MSSDEFDKETESSDGLQPKQADLSCVHALNKLHLHEIHVVPSKHEADQYVHVIDGQLVQDPLKRNDVESLFEQARRAGAKDGTLDQHQPSSSSKSFSGRGRLPSGETPSAAPQQQPEPEVHTITFWTNGFTVKDGPLRRLDDPQNASFLEARNFRNPTTFGYHGVLLVPSFETVGLGPETDYLSPSYDLLNKGPFFTRSWASRNKMARSSILGPASGDFLTSAQVCCCPTAEALERKKRDVVEGQPLCDPHSELKPTILILPPWVAFNSLSSLESRLQLRFKRGKKLHKKEKDYWPFPFHHVTEAGANGQRRDMTRMVTVVVGVGRAKYLGPLGVGILNPHLDGDEDVKRFPDKNENNKYDFKGIFNGLTCSIEVDSVVHVHNESQSVIIWYTKDMGEECSERVTYTLRSLKKAKLNSKFRGSKIIQLENIRTAIMEEIQSVQSRSYILSLMQDIVKYGDEKSKLLFCEATAVVIYLGNHLFSDLRGPSKAGWRTTAIIHVGFVSLALEMIQMAQY
ncbi:plant UBX domain-containing protein 4-like protein [Tanacetum coccineum]